MLGLPNWPATRRDIDFVRSFGTIRKRDLGGLSSWVGEAEVCEAARALRFPSLPAFKDGGNLKLPIGLAFRRFYYDGRAMGKFEVGISADSWMSIELLQEQTGKFLDHCLNLPIDIFDPRPDAGKKTKPTLVRASKLLSKLYLFSTTKVSLAKDPAWWNAVSPSWWVRAGSPVLFLVHKETEAIELPVAGKKVSLDSRLGFSLTYCEIPNNGKNIPLWV